MYYVYKATNRTNGKFYVGRCVGPVKEREIKHWWYAKHKQSNTPFPNALRKYGRDAFEWSIVEECSVDNVADREIYWINELNPQYNATLGGDGGRLGVPCPQHVKDATTKANSKQVKDKRTGKVYASLTEASEATGVMVSSISRSMKNKGGNWAPFLCL